MCVNVFEISVGRIEIGCVVGVMYRDLPSSVVMLDALTLMLFRQINNIFPPPTSISGRVGVRVGGRTQDAAESTNSFLRLDAFQGIFPFRFDLGQKTD